MAAIPTEEGLFRANYNKEIDGDMVALRIRVEREKNKDFLESENPPVEEKIYIKFIFDLSNEKRISLLQVIYDNRKMSNSNIVSVKLISNIVYKIKTDKLALRNIFYGQILMLALNKSDGMTVLFKKISTDYSLNKVMMNKEKLFLLNSYRNYLMAIKSDKTLANSLESPLKSEDSEKQKNIKEVLEKKMYRASTGVKLEREGSRFYWDVSRENFYARFTNKDHAPLKMDIRLSQGLVNIRYSNFVLFNGIHQLPRQMTIGLENERRNLIEFLKFQEFQNKGKGLRERAQKYKEAFIETKKMRQKEEIVGEKKSKRPHSFPFIF